MSTDPLSFEQLDQIRKALADLEVVDNGLTGVKGRYGWSDRGVSKTVNMLADLSLLLDEVDRLRELKCETCGMRVAHLNCNGYVIGWGCADGEKCEPASGMPHTPAQGAAAELEKIRADLDASKARRDAPPETEIEYLQRMGAEFRSNMARLAARDDAEATVPAAQPGAGDAETSGTGSGRGTGEPNAHGSAQAIENLNSKHWLKWNTTARTITGCQCGFAANEDADCGFGDSVVAHLLEVGARTAAPDVDGWTLHARPGGLQVSHDTDADMPVLLHDQHLPLGAVLAFIADLDEDAGR